MIETEHLFRVSADTVKIRDMSSVFLVVLASFKKLAGDPKYYMGKVLPLSQLIHTSAKKMAVVFKLAKSPLIRVSTRVAVFPLSPSPQCNMTGSCRLCAISNIPKVAVLGIPTFASCTGLGYCFSVVGKISSTSISSTGIHV